MRSFFDKFKKYKENMKWPEWDKRVSSEEVQNRLEICSSCDKFNSAIKICKVCKCHIPSKSLFYYSECPLDKWPINNVE